MSHTRSTRTKLLAIGGTSLALALGAVAVAVAVAGRSPVHFAHSAHPAHHATPVGSVTVRITGVDDVRCPHGPAPSTGAMPRLPAPAAGALARLGSLESTGADLAAGGGESADHGQGGATPDAVMSRADAAELQRQLHTAARAACGLLDTQSAQAAGYYLGSPDVEGVGTHWINWAAVNRPFDPAHPSMLLFSAAGSRSHLVGFSYWVRSAQEPDGFAGGADQWHRHFGLCFDAAGQWSAEEVRPSECHGTYLNGRDLWMLHAWIVPGTDNPTGVFAPRLRALCHPNVPDVARCPGIGR